MLYLQVYGGGRQYRRESMAIMATITKIEDSKSALDDEASWPSWMSNASLWLFPPSSRRVRHGCQHAQAQHGASRCLSSASQSHSSQASRFMSSPW